MFTVIELRVGVFAQGGHIYTTEMDSHQSFSPCLKAWASNICNHSNGSMKGPSRERWKLLPKFSDDRRY
jgi:hypothetical protein